MDYDEGDEDKTGTLIIALMQKERRKKKYQGADILTIGYSIYKVIDVFLYTVFQRSPLVGILIWPVTGT